MKKSMKKSWKRILAWVMAFSLAMSLMPVSVAAEETAQELPASIHWDYKNPLYEDVTVEKEETDSDNLVDRPTLYADGDTYDGPAYATLEEAGDEIRAYLVQREDVAEVGVLVDDYEPYFENEGELAIALAQDVLSYALAHTGNPEEGDYLLWQLSDIAVEIGAYSYDDGYMLLLSYHDIIYYTTLEQEEELTGAVDELLEDLKVSGRNDYETIKTIYDYMCENITYDNENLNDESYTLKYTAYAALMDKTAVCQGYALLLYRLALETGIDCRLIAGEGNGEDHGWNIVLMDDGYYYNADSTWDAGASEYACFLVSDENLASHVRDAEYATEDFYDYYPMGQDNYEPKEHNYVGVVTEPTCTEKGYTTYTCEICGDTYVGDETEKRAHSYVGEVTEPTCIEGGYTTYTCEVCGDRYVDDETEVAAHSYVGVVTEPTCTEGGYTTYTCEVCGDSYVDDETEVAAHSYVGVVTEPTCQEGGYTTYTCEVCGDSYVGDETDVVAHSYVGVVTKPTCTEGGYTTYTCSMCEKSYVADETEIIAHDYVGEVTEPTCTEGGYTTYTCSMCQDSYVDDRTETIDHSYVGVVTEPTCKETGYTTYTCEVCGHSYVDDQTEIVDHNYVAVVTEPTCQEGGYTTYTCEYCGKSYVADETEIVDHNYVGVVTEPTCQEGGYTTYTCDMCGDSIVVDKTEKVDHNYIPVVTEPTCQEGGYTTYTCEYCEDSYVADETEIVDHNYVAVVTEPTCEEDGYTTHTCEYCEDSYVTDETEALGHDFVDGYCTVCGVSDAPEAPELLSIYSKEQTSAKATWTIVEDADGYELWRATAMDAPEEEWQRVKSITDGTKDRYTNQGLEKGITYYYKVRAYKLDTDQNRIYSEFSEVKYMPAAVVYDNVYSNATYRIRLLWNEISGADGYQLWRLEDDGETWKVVKTLGDKGNELTDDQGATTAYSNTGLEAGKTYTYKMRAFAIPEEGTKVFGAYSDEFTVATMPETPEVTGTSSKEGRAVLTWDAVNGAAGYQVWMSETEDGEYTIVKSITDGTTETYTKYDLTSGKTYYFKVRAYTEVEGKKTFGAYCDAVAVKIK